MRRIFFLCLLLQAIVGHAQTHDSLKLKLHPWSNLTTTVFTTDTSINYFPFYNGVQVIEVNYYVRSVPREDPLPPVIGQKPVVLIHNVPNRYLIRDTNGVIVQNYGVTDIEKLALQPPANAPTMSHKKRLDNGKVKWYNVNGNKKHTEFLENGYGYVYRGENNSYTIIDTFGVARLSNYQYIAFLGSCYSVMENGFFALFDQEFRQRTPFNYQSIRLISEGVFLANYQIINIDGELLDTNQYQNITFNSTQNSHIIYKLNGKYGLMDRKLNHLTEPRFKSIDTLNGKGYAVTNDNDKLAILNVHGEQITPFKYEPIWAYWRKDGYLEVKQKYEGWHRDSKRPPIGIGLLDSTGQEVVPPKYDKIELIHNGVGSAHLRDYNDLYYYKGLINTKREELTEFIYTDLKFYQGYFIAEISGKQGLLDTNGNEVVPLNYKQINTVREGMAQVKGDNGKYGYINLNGGKDIPFIYQGGSPFLGGVAAVIVEGKQGLINQNGEELTDFKYDIIFSYHIGYWLVKKEGRYGAIDSTGKEIVPLIYTKTEQLPDGRTKFSNESESYILLE